MPRSVLHLDPKDAMARHDIDELGAIELRNIICAKYGGVDVKADDLRAMLDDLAAHGFKIMGSDLAH